MKPRMLRSAVDMTKVESMDQDENRIDFFMLNMKKTIHFTSEKEAVDYFYTALELMSTRQNVLELALYKTSTEGS